MKYIIYRISVGDYNYIGSTKDFKQRKATHKCGYKTREMKVYKMIREAGGWDKCEMVPIEEFECDTLLDARIREEHWRIYHQANMNSCRAHTTKEQRIEQVKERNEKNKDKNKEKRQLKQTCECGGTYTYNHKVRHYKTKNHTKYLEQQNLTIN